MLRPREIIGVDFSGAAEAGRFIWLARCTVLSEGEPIELRSLARLEDLAGSSKRDVVLRWLLDAILASRDAIWGIDAPFGLPIELGWTDWPTQLDAVSRWTEGANAFGRHCCERSLAAVGKLHVRRETDRETRTPFDCYHYRIVHQMFHAMRELMVPLRADKSTAVLPFEIEQLRGAKRVVAEACPGSTLRRLALPHNRYKQSTSGRVAAPLVATRRRILAGIEPLVTIDVRSRRTMLANPGGDALDAVLAAVGVWHAWSKFDRGLVVRHPRYRREGMVFC